MLIFYLPGNKAQGLLCNHRLFYAGLAAGHELMISKILESTFSLGNRS